MIEAPPKTTAAETRKAFSLAGNEEFRAVITECTAKYLYWDKVKYLSGAFDPRVVWAFLLWSRRMNSSSVCLGKYQFRISVTNAMQEVLHHFDMQMGGIIPVSSVASKEEQKYYLLSSFMEEAIASSQMEGASTTRKVAKEMLRKNEAPKDVSQRMIVNNYNTIRYLSEHKTDALTPASLCMIHQMITERTLDSSDEETEYRTTDDIVVADGISGEVAHVPPPSAELPDLVDELCAFFNTDECASGFIHPVVKAIAIHFFVAWIHPFTDGNGRTARALVYWFLLQKGYSLVEYLSISRIIYRSKAQYEKAFLYTEKMDGDLGYFLQYNLTAMQKAMDELGTYLKRKISEKNDLSSYVKRGLNQRQAKFLAYMKQNADSVVTVAEYQSICGVSNQTARTDLYALCKSGVLQEIPLNKRKAGFLLSGNA